MGNIVGSLGKSVVRKSRRFNIESRTESFLKKNVKVVPPKPAATQREIEKLNEEMPGLYDEIHKRNPVLLDRLKDVYVSSQDTPLDKIPVNENPDRPLPAERKTMLEELGYVEPERVSDGRLTLRQGLQILSKYELEKTPSNVAKLAQEYNMNVKDVGHIVENFKLYTLVNIKDEGDLDVPTEAEKNLDQKVNIRTFPKLQKLMEIKRDSSIEEKEAKNEKSPSDEDEKLK